MAWAQYVALGFAPCLFWLLYLRRKDRFEPEPRALVVRVFLLGCLTPAVILRVRPHLDELLPEAFATPRLLLDAFLVTALCEELVKVAAMMAGVWFHRELDEPLDGIIYGGAAALGFASVENVLFLQATDTPTLALQRGFTTVLVHVACTGTLGLLLARLRIGRRPRDLAAVALGLVAVVAAHGAYDACLLAGSGTLALLVVLPLILLLFGALLRAAMRDSAARSLSAASRR